jgi:small subunit ribosomal protein S13
MARIAGVDLPREKPTEIGLRYILGIGPTTARQVVQRAAVNGATRIKDLTEEEVNRIREIIDRGFVVEGDLRREIKMNIDRLREIGCYRGLRHRRNLPVRGQRTRTNARTVGWPPRRRPRSAVGGRKKATKK